jgi:hypothetical protein
MVDGGRVARSTPVNCVPVSLCIAARSARGAPAAVCADGHAPTGVLPTVTSRH